MQINLLILYVAATGNIVLDVTPLLLDTPDKCQIISMTPVAVSISARVSFTVQGFNLAQPTTRYVLCLIGVCEYLGNADFLISPHLTL